MLRAVRTGGPVKGGGVRKEYDDLVATWGIRPRLAELLDERGCLSACSPAPSVGAVPARRRGGALAPPAQVAFTFRDPAIVESSGLVVADGLVVTTNDSGDTGRVFAVDPATGETVGRDRAGPTTRPTSRRWPRPGPARSGSATSATTARPATRSRSRGSRSGAATATSTGRRTTSSTPTAPHERRDAAARPAHRAGSTSPPRTSSAARCYAAPAHARRRPAQPARAGRRRAADRHRRRVPPRRAAPGGAQLLAWPRSTPSRRWSRSAVPAARPGAGRGDRASTPTARCCSAPRALHADVLRVRAARRADGDGAAPSCRRPSRLAAPRTESREDSELPETTADRRSAWPWFLDRLVAVWAASRVLIRSLRRR